MATYSKGKIASLASMWKNWNLLLHWSRDGEGIAMDCQLDLESLGEAALGTPVSDYLG